MNDLDLRIRIRNLDANKSVNSLADIVFKSGDRAYKADFVGDGYYVIPATVFEDLLALGYVQEISSDSQKEHVFEITAAGRKAAVGRASGGDNEPG